MHHRYVEVRALVVGAMLIVVANGEAVGQQTIADEGSQLMERLDNYRALNTTSRMRTSRLSGFIEGRYGVIPPVNWEKAIAAIQEGSSPIDFPAENELAVKYVDGQILISDGSRTIRVNESDLNREDYGPSQNLLAFSRENDVFLLDSVHIAVPYKVTRVDSSGAIEWQQELSFLPTNIGGGGATHSVEAMITKDRLILFGAAFPVAYCAVMERKAGRIEDWCIFDQRETVKGVKPE